MMNLKVIFEFLENNLSGDEKSLNVNFEKLNFVGESSSDKVLTKTFPDENFKSYLKSIKGKDQENFLSLITKNKNFDSFEAFWKISEIKKFLNFYQKKIVRKELFYIMWQKK
jgi:hypothetical protein